MITLDTINNEIVRPIPHYGGGDQRPVLGADLFQEVYANIFLCAKKKSGKTSAVWHILRRCVGRDTKLIIFCSTLHKDHNWKEIRTYFEDKGNDVEAYTSMRDPDGFDLLQELLTQLEANDEEDEDLDAEEYLKQEGGRHAKDVYDYNMRSRKPRKKRKTKYLAPELIIVLDDLSTELKSKTLVSLLKKNRHFKCKIIMSSQYYLDLLPESRKQIDYFLIFGSQTKEKLEAIHKDSDTAITYELFERLYENATAAKYNFLFVDTVNDEFRKNFNKLYDLRRINS